METKERIIETVANDTEIDYKAEYERLISEVNELRKGNQELASQLNRLVSLYNKLFDYAVTGR